MKETTEGIVFGKFKKKKQSIVSSELPSEIIREIGRFLEAPEAVRFSQTCRSIFTDLSFTTHSFLATGNIETTTTTLRGDQQQEGNPPVCTGAIVPQYDDSFHSMTFRCKWKDQGRGRRKGRLYVVAYEIPDDLDALSENFEQSLKALPFKKRNVVYMSGFAHHRLSSLQVPICPQPKKIYKIWCKIGPESYFSLNFKEISLHMAAFDNHVPTCAFYQFQQERLPLPPMPILPLFPMPQTRQRGGHQDSWWALVPDD